MPSPFPGMDPYLEGYLWPDVHQSLAGQFKRQLSPLLRSRYVVRLAVYNELITSIEILSPTNKREPGLSAYRQQRAELIQAGVHILELDLIRRGERPWLPEEEEVPASPYLALLTRAGQPYTEVWPIQLWDPLPVLPVPLRAPDADVPLDVQTALTVIYDESDYGRTIDYRQAPPKPTLAGEDAAWLDDQLQKAGLRS